MQLHTLLSGKIKVTATIDSELVKWIDSQVCNRRFASRTHALEVAIQHLRDSA